MALHMTERVAENIRLALAKSGTTQAAFAEALGMSKAKTSQVVNGISTLTLEEYFKASSFFGVTLDWLAQEHLGELEKPV